MSEPVTSTVLAKWIVLGTWAMIGGITHALIENRKGKSKGFLDGFILAMISGFAGAMWGLIAIKFYPNDITIIAFASGMGGYMSTEGVVLLINYIKQKYLK